MYALVEIAGKQYRAEEGALLKVDRLPASEGDTVKLDSVLLVKDGSSVAVGTPYVGGAVVTATVEGTGRDDKITVFKYKKRKRYKRKHGHRQHYSMLRVRDVASQ
ncbi:MAG: 50S ribosomal protein L21 [Spirochaetales bacterium]